MPVRKYSKQAKLEFTSRKPREKKSMHSFEFQFCKYFT